MVPHYVHGLTVSSGDREMDYTCRIYCMMYPETVDIKKVGLENSCPHNIIHFGVFCARDLTNTLEAT